MKLKVYQIDNHLDKYNVHFSDYDTTLYRAGEVSPSLYKCVFDGNIEAETLEDVYIRLNINHPVGFQGYSLSVSDIIEIFPDTNHPEAYAECYYCDIIGFKKLKDFDTSNISPIEGKKMLVLEPHTEPYIVKIPDNLDSLQKAVGGLIECTYPFDDNAFVIGNEEAKLIGLEGNRRISGEIYAGVLLIAADDGQGGINDLTPTQIEKYTQQFYTPEEISPKEVDESIGFTIIGFS